MMKKNLKNALSIDIEDWFQIVSSVELRGPLIPIQNKTLEQFYLTLDFLDEIGCKATFFIQGELASTYPEIVRKTVQNGHEVASHGYKHYPLWEMTPRQFKEDLELSIKVLEDIGGVKVKGYRAPFFSLLPSSQWAWNIMAELGLKYSSSVSPSKFPSINKPTKVANGRLVEFPLTCIEKFGRRWNISGGRFPRFLPLNILHHHLKKLNEEGLPALFYFHNYELERNLKLNLRDFPLIKRCWAYLYVFAYNINLSGVPRKIRILSRRNVVFAPVSHVLESLGMLTE
jgi:polysaccharide deacetylase family protein (PEP-CTERM system associated)